ncbi:MAG: inorganic phosphate transporter [Verrucomicrobia bacterium]|nr:inorganic phosphate transporter [Verrucomicrobiota bacterium]
MTLTIIITVIIVALIFEYINGFHDTANSIATVVGTKVLTPRQAIILAALTNLVGALAGDAVAKTVTSGIVDMKFIASGVAQHMLVCALLGGIIWNLITWWFGLPSSSSHAMIGGLCGAGIAITNDNWSVLKWIELKSKKELVAAPADVLSQLGDRVLEVGTNAVTLGTNQMVFVLKGGQTLMETTVVDKGGIFYKVVIPMFSSPIAGFTFGLLIMGALYALCRSWRPTTVNRVFGKLQLVSAGYMGFSHGLNDAQKTMGIITLGLVAATTGGAFADAPEWMSFLKTEDSKPMTWVKVICAITMAAGTAAGGWRIIKTLGHKMVKLQPVHGFAAETTAASVLFVAGHLGMPVSTTHAISTSIMGVGCAKRFSALKLTVVERVVWAWILTLPAAGGLAYGLVKLGRAMGAIPS